MIAEAFLEAARRGDVAFFLKLSQSDLANVAKTQKDEDSRTLLHNACTSGNLELIKIIADAGPDAKNVQDDEGWTPLISAASSSHDNVVEYLLSIGSDVHVTNSSGRTALHYAASKGGISILRLLHKAGASANAKDATGSTPLHRAASAGKGEAVRILLGECKANIEERDATGSTPLLVALEADFPQIALLLASQGASLTAANKEGVTPMSICNQQLRDALEAASRGEAMDQD